MNNRIKELRKTLGLSGEKFGQALGLSRMAISSLETGRNNLTEQTIILICKTFNVSETWLREGVGEMFNPTDESYFAELKEKYGLSPLAIEVFKAYIALPADKREAFEWAIDNMFAKNETDEELVELIKSLDDEEKQKVKSFILGLLQEKVEVPEDYIRETVSVYIGAKCGLGYYLHEEQVEEREVVIPKGLNYDFALLASGDSMQPTIKNGDVCFVKKGDLINGRIYSIIVDNEGYIKRLNFLKDKIIAISDNEAYKPIEWTGSDLENAIICGEVIHITKGR